MAVKANQLIAMKSQDGICAFSYCQLSSNAFCPSKSWVFLVRGLDALGWKIFVKESVISRSGKKNLSLNCIVFLVLLSHGAEWGEMGDSPVQCVPQS